jgi:hypothetical protein
MMAGLAVAWMAIGYAVTGPAQPAAKGSAMKIEVQLLWSTDDATSPNPKHKPAEADIEKKLKALPLKWKNYFLVKRMTMDVPSLDSKTEALSEKCSVEVKDLGKSMVEVSYFGKNKKVEKRKQAFPKGEMLVYGGNAPGTNAWFVVLKRVE